MPALVKPPTKKSSKGAKPTSAKPVPAAPTKRKNPSKNETEEKDERKPKKLKGKEKIQDDEVPASKSIKGGKESTAKERVEAKDKGRTSRGKAEDSKGKVNQTKVSEARKGILKGTTKRKKEPAPSPEPSDSESEEDDGDEEVVNASESGDETHEEVEVDESSDDNEAPLHGFSSESDSSDEEDDVDDKAPIDIGKLPTVAKDDATVKRKLEKAKKQTTEDRGVLYLGRIPHGFYEDQMKAYFSQFGDITRLRLSRNKKTGRSRHYAFIEFKSSAVAQIVAETMDNYLLMGRLLQCKIVPKEELHPELWIGANRKFRRVPTARIQRFQHNKIRTQEEKKNVERRLLKRQQQKKRKLEALGIDYDPAPVFYSKKAKKNA